MIPRETRQRNACAGAFSIFETDHFQADFARDGFTGEMDGFRHLFLDGEANRFDRGPFLEDDFHADDRLSLDDGGFDAPA